MNESDATCTRPPEGWWCSRVAGHNGPCAARPRGEETVVRTPRYMADPESVLFGTWGLIVTILLPLMVLPWALSLGATWLWLVIIIPELVAVFITFVLLVMPLFSKWMWSTWQPGDEYVSGMHVDSFGRPVVSSSKWRG